MKKFYGGLFIRKENLEAEGIYYPIKLEYYKRINKEEFEDKNNSKYGIEIVKTEYIPNNTKIEIKEIKHLSDDEDKIEGILDMLKENEVTPIAVEDIIYDIALNKTKFQ